MKNLLLGLVLLAGCSSQGYVKAEALSPTMKSVRARHDAYVIADPAYDDPKSDKFGQRASDLRDTQLLDETLDEAKAPSPKPATVDDNLKR